MSLGDDLAAALPVLRAEAESMMRDACTVSRASDAPPVFNDETGLYEPATGSTVYSGRCQVQLVDVLPQVAVSGEADVSSQRAIVKLPVDGSEGVKIGDVVVITAATLDADLLGRSYVVRGLHHKSFATARRLQCEEVV